MQAHRQALIDLGYKDCYHFTALLQENPRDMDMWIDAFKGKFHGGGDGGEDDDEFTKEQWDQLLGHCMAVTDTPCTVFYKELLEAYPHAKVILTVRDDRDQWFKSIMQTIIPFL